MAINFEPLTSFATLVGAIDLNRLGGSGEPPLPDIFRADSGLLFASAFGRIAVCLLPKMR
jgi:hypothetical protein